jgi:hypothetical protein
MIDFEEVDEFSKDVKKLHKKFNSIDSDLGTFKKALISELPNHLSGTIRVSNLGENVKVPIYKVRRFRCKALNKGNRSGIRIIYAYEQNEDKITLIEAYYKGSQENEDRKRILKYFQVKNA